MRGHTPHGSRADASQAARLCSGREWERAARGADGRVYPAGDILHPDDANFDATYATDPDQMGADEVGSFVADRSPFGVLDLTGNVAEWIGEGAARRAAASGAMSGRALRPPSKR